MNLKIDRLNNIFNIALVTSIIGALFLCAWYFIFNELTFHTDIARDFLLIEQIIDTKRPTLIGPRSGGIPGVFHGPLWLYLHIPAFVIGSGNPVAIAWFWWLLVIVFVIVVYYISKKLFGEIPALLAALVCALKLVDSTKSLFNPFGAVLLFPVFFYTLLLYLQTSNVRYLLVGIFSLGLIIQFQIAFGLPIFILTFFLVVAFILRKKQFKDLLAFLILLIPLSTYVIFELRNNFLQFRSVLTYISSGEQINSSSFSGVFAERIRTMLTEGFYILGKEYQLLIFVFIIGMTYTLYKKWNTKDIYKYSFLLFIYLYVGYWLISIFFKGFIWSYYYWPFLGVSAILFTSIYKYIPKPLFAAIYLYLIAILSTQAIDSVRAYRTRVDKDPGMWRFNHKVAETIFNDAKEEFGYYIYTPDQFGYTPRYAMNYVQRNKKDQTAYPYQKKRLTYLLIAAPPSDRPELDGKWWKQDQVKITKKPTRVMDINGVFRVEKYILSPEEINTPSDPNIIHDLHFR